MRSQVFGTQLSEPATCMRRTRKRERNKEEEEKKNKSVCAVRSCKVEQL